MAMKPIDTYAVSNNSVLDSLTVLYIQYLMQKHLRCKKSCGQVK